MATVPPFTLDSTHLLAGWHNGLHFQWEFGAYINIDLALSERHDYRLTYNYPAWRNDRKVFHPGERLPRFQVKR